MERVVVQEAEVLLHAKCEDVMGQMGLQLPDFRRSDRVKVTFTQVASCLVTHDGRRHTPACRRCHALSDIVFCCILSTPAERWSDNYRPVEIFSVACFFPSRSCTSQTVSMCSVFNVILILGTLTGRRATEQQVNRLLDHRIFVCQPPARHSSAQEHRHHYAGVHLQ